MENQEKKKEEEEKKKEEKEKKKEEKLPFCTNAPSPEHARAESEDEPCDDSRGAE
jgi:hypothetical protein